MQLVNLPNILTLINLFAGCMAVVFLFNYQIEWVPYCVLVSLVADFFDGFAARFTKNSTDLGKQLDSLADVVSFGLVPGAVLFQLLFQKYQSGHVGYSLTEIYLYSAPAFLITLCAALRLAKFNIDNRQTSGFIGLATPAAGIFVVGCLLTFLNNSLGLASFIFDQKVLYAIIIFVSALMVSEMPMFAFKFKSLAWKGNEAVYVFIILAAVLTAGLIFAGGLFAAIPLIIILYIIVSIVASVVKSNN